MSVTRSEIAAELVLRFPEVPYETLLAALFALEQAITDGLKRREEVRVQGFGRWKMTNPKPNPRSLHGPTTSRPHVTFRLVMRGKLLFPRKRKCTP